MYIEYVTMRQILSCLGIAEKIRKKNYSMFARGSHLMNFAFNYLSPYVGQLGCFDAF